MPHYCIVYGCKSKSSTYPGLTFHSVPVRDRSIRDKWFSQIKRDKSHVSLTSAAKVCSNHFHKNDFVRLKCKRKRLKRDSIPSKFAWTTPADGESSDDDFERPAVKKRRELAEIEDEETDSASEGECDLLPQIPGVISKATQYYKEDFTDNDEEEECDHTFSVIRLYRKCTSSAMEYKFFMHFTGFASKQRLVDFAQFFFPTMDSDDIIYWKTKECKNRLIHMEDVLEEGTFSRTVLDDEETDIGEHRYRKMNPWNELLMTLMKLRTGCSNIDLAIRFNVSEGTVSNKVITYINLLYTTLGSLKIWPHRDIILKHAPKKFSKKYPNTVIIIDATELIVHVPSALQKQSECFSRYKHHTTLKGLLGVDPTGGIMFISQLFEGSISDKELVKRSGFLNVLKAKLECGEIVKGDTVMADRGFLIEDELTSLGLLLNSPPFLRQKGSFSRDDVIRTQTIAKHRIHIERAIAKIKGFRFFQSPIPISMFGTINQIWTVICLITNFQNPILTENEGEDAAPESA